MDRRICAERSVSTALQDALFIPLSLRLFQMHCRDHGSAPIRVTAPVYTVAFVGRREWSGNPQALLGAEILGPRIFLHDQWQRH